MLFSYNAVKGQPSSDSLMHYLEIAAKNNPLVLQKFNEYKAALEKVPQVGSLQDPELNLGVFLTPMELVSGNQVADVRLMQMFPWFGVLKSAKSEMSLMAKARFESLRDAKLQVFYDVRRTWYELQKIQQDIRISNMNLDIMRMVERVALVKYKFPAEKSAPSSAPAGMNPRNSLQTPSSGASNMGGMNSTGNQGRSSVQSSSIAESSMGSSGNVTGLSDIYRIQIEIQDLQNNIALLQNQEKTVGARFNTYLNRPVDSGIALPDTLLANVLGTSLNSISDSMLKNNPMLGMLQYEKLSLDARKKMVTGMGRPMVGFGVDYSVINRSSMSASPMNGKDMVMPMAAVTLPIYRKKYKAMQNEVAFQKIATENGINATSNNLQNEYYEASQLYLDAQRRINQYENQSQLAKRSLDIMIKSFSVSGAGLTEILKVRQQLLDYQMKKVESIADFNTSIAWLERLMANSQIK